MTVTVTLTVTVTVTVPVNYDALEEEEEEIYYKIISMLNMIGMSRRTSIEGSPVPGFFMPCRVHILTYCMHMYIYTHTIYLQPQATPTVTKEVTVHFVKRSELASDSSAKSAEAYEVCVCVYDMRSVFMRFLCVCMA